AAGDLDSVLVELALPKQACEHRAPQLQLWRDVPRRRALVRARCGVEIECVETGHGASLRRRSLSNSSYVVRKHQSRRSLVVGHRQDRPRSSSMCSMPVRSKLIALRLLKCSFIGAMLAIALGVLAFALVPIFDAVMLYVAPSRLLIPIIGPLV